MRPTIMEVSTKNFIYNIEQIKKYTNNINIMPTIKANGYGTYINKRLDIINMFDIVSVAIADEAVSLRNIGYKKDIFILNQPYIDELDEIIDNNITIGLCEETFTDEVIKLNKNIKVHLEIDTGMGRTGINPDNLENFINKIINHKNIQVEGIYTHLSSADIDFEYTNKQLETFEKCVNIVKKYYNLKYIHSNASNGIINFNNGCSNLIRPGIIMYGYESYKGVLNKIDLKPVCKLKSKITFLKEVPKGTSIGYSRKFIADKKTLVATIPIGYADGISRSLFNKGTVIVNGKKVPIIGNICMDNIMVDVTNIDVKVGDDIYIWDNDIIKVDDIANMLNTINYEIISRISDRVPRVFID